MIVYLFLSAAIYERKMYYIYIIPIKKLHKRALISHPQLQENNIYIFHFIISSLTQALRWIVHYEML